MDSFYIETNYIIFNNQTGLMEYCLWDKTQHFKQLQKAIGGHFQIIYSTETDIDDGDDFKLLKCGKKSYYTHYTIYGDEEGLSKRLSLNQQANSYIPEDILVRLAYIGGPCGTIVLECNQKTVCKLSLKHLFKRVITAEMMLDGEINVAGEYFELFYDAVKLAINNHQVFQVVDDESIEISDISLIINHIPEEYDLSNVSLN